MNNNYNKLAETAIEVVELTETDNTVCFSGKKQESTYARRGCAVFYVSSANTGDSNKCMKRKNNL
jgi:hypothetical protein